MKTLLFAATVVAISITTFSADFHSKDELDNVDAKECPICVEEISEKSVISILPCGHMSCSSCCVKYLGPSITKPCFICRQPFQKNTISRMLKEQVGGIGAVLLWKMRQNSEEKMVERLRNFRNSQKMTSSELATALVAADADNNSLVAYAKMRKWKDFAKELQICNVDVGNLDEFEEKKEEKPAVVETSALLSDGEDIRSRQLIHDLNNVEDIIGFHDDGKRISRSKYKFVARKNILNREETFLSNVIFKAKLKNVSFQKSTIDNSSLVGTFDKYDCSQCMIKNTTYEGKISNSWFDGAHINKVIFDASFLKKHMHMTTFKHAYLEHVLFKNHHLKGMTLRGAKLKHVIVPTKTLKKSASFLDGAFIWDGEQYIVVTKEQTKIFQERCLQLGIDQIDLTILVGN